MLRRIAAIILGILITVGMAKADTKATPTPPNISQDFFLRQLREEGYLIFKGNESIKLAQEVLEKLEKDVTISLNLSDLKRNISFVGIAVRPFGRRYITMLYIVEGRYNINDIREFLVERSAFLKEPLEIKGVNRGWKFIGSTTWKVRYASQYGGQVYHAIRIKYYYTASTLDNTHTSLRFPILGTWIGNTSP
ncbi:hypothetical protein PFDSM3638_00095 [Pyrococcus furiosus DSM 3638]|uniref:Uncharacterized protein n=3 Tax=Pyrococcus furiosus TaxID=2261 RepID=A0A5C0XM97_PYRFU|nr:MULTISPECIES: hypothetical protein [Pyrococcus]AAL80158.1 hypothetical protein PF0034 [Pyrococcus furiosus DSM 3638]AFN04539.1 hypothetical protein PFC_08035 [Pyrococcus furiosus COM1]MDK2869176.1 hypothetical protein [Pyrococcus sp.]QEK77769.1 hypothetical protein PFDSM3638_00095 [Pyrococcus furiosus DSM 3638]